jgi:TRAP-type uncharacterized transport system substrate-binding protein
MRGEGFMRRKVAIFFSNDEGKYYIENAAVFTGYDIPKTSYKHEPVRVIDETVDWRNYEITRDELANPTTEDGDVLVVVKELE